LKKVLRISAGVGLVLIGIVGLILPIMPGWVFIIPGLVILAEHSPRIRRLLEWARAKFEDARGVSKTPPVPTPSATMEDRPGAGR
jgi:uncharacterized membrane protein YbaN (DUF454 family)